MRRAIAILFAGAAGLAAAQGAPTVNLNTGDLTYVYPFDLPAARGRFQPRLGLVYSSASRANTGYGFGWSLSISYVEADLRQRAGNAYLLVQGSERKPLVKMADGTWRAEVEANWLPLTFAGNTWSGTDAGGLSYTFQCVTTSCNRWYLTRVAQPSIQGTQNETVFVYGAEGSSASATLSEIRYSKLPINGYGTYVTLEYQTGAAGGLEMVAGTLVDHQRRLSRVLVKNKDLGIVRGWDIAYTPAPDTHVSLLTSITEKGVGATNGLPSTQFTYTTGAYSLGTATAISIYNPSLNAYNVIAPNCSSGQWCSLPTGGYWLDFDGDGRPDVTSNDQLGNWTRSWARNVTPPGSGTPQFANWASIPGARPGPGDSLRVDVDGDGILDEISGRTSTCNSSDLLEIRFGSNGGGFHFEPPVCVNAHVAHYKWWTIWGPTACPGCTYATSSPGPGALNYYFQDVNGDGIPDVAIHSTSCGAGPCPAYVYRGKIDRSSPTVYSLEPFPGDPEPTLGSANNSESNAEGGVASLDLNGDGLRDTVLAPAWSAYLDPVGASAVSWQRDPNWVLGLADHPMVAVSNVYCPGVTQVPDHRRTKGALVDLNGDGLADYVFYSGSGGWMVSWNTGRSFASPQAVGFSVYPSEARVANFICVSASGDDIYSSVGGSNRAFFDVNGDGVADQVYNWTLAAGALGPATRTNLLSSVTTPLGAGYVIAWLSAGVSGGKPGKRMVKTITRAGIGLEGLTTRYWYANPSGGTSPLELGRYEDRGFRDAWTQDSVTKLVTHTVFAVDSHALNGMATREEIGTAQSWDPTASTPPAFAVFKWAETSLAAKTAASGTDCLSAGEPAVSAYPVRVVPTQVTAATVLGTVTGSVVVSTRCLDVDQYGNMASVKSQQIFAGPTINTAYGPVAETRNERTGVDAALCKSAPQTVKRLDGAGNVLTQEKQEYTDGTNCWLSRKYGVGDGFFARPQTGLVTYTFGQFGVLSATTAGGVTKSFTYDADLLRVTQETTSDSGVTVASDFAYDPVTGLKTSEVGPYLKEILVGAQKVAATAANAGQAVVGTARYYSYDDFGRKIAVARASFSGNQASQALEAYEYMDTPATGTPVSVRSYRFSVPRSFLLRQTPSQVPTNDDVAIAVSYLDVLGRIIQVRERLGGGAAADPAAQVTQTATGYRVAKAVFYDGAGRAWASLDPFYSTSGEAFVDYRAAGSLPGAGLRGTITTFDSAGRVWCTAYQAIAGSLPAAPSDCRSNSSDSSSFRLANESQYYYRYEAGRGLIGGHFFAVKTIPPQLNADPNNSAYFEKLTDPAGLEYASIDPEGRRVWIDRDALGREIASWRESANRNLTTAYSAGSGLPTAASWIVYNTAGQVIQSWDANWGPDASGGTRYRFYDEAGRLTKVATTSSGSDGVEYVFDSANGNLGQVVEVWELVGSARKPTPVARNWYHKPFRISDTRLAYTAGRLAWTENGDTTVGTSIVYGYDDAGRVTYREQGFARLDTAAPGKRYSVTGSYGADGRITRSEVWDGGASAAFWHQVEYDSAGRPVRIPDWTGSANAQFWKAENPGALATGAYDALGRIPSMTADGGNVSSVRTYGTYSGLLISETKANTAGEVFYETANTQYQGDKLKSFDDTGSRTSYLNTYKQGGQVDVATAAPQSGTVPGQLTQDYRHTFGYSGVASLATASEVADAAPESLAAGKRTTESQRTLTYVSPVAGVVKDQLASVTTTSLESGVPKCSSTMSVNYDSLGRVQDKAADVYWNGSSCATRPAEGFRYDLQGHLTWVSRAGAEEERISYGPGGEILYRQLKEKFVFYVGLYATVTASDSPSCVVGGDTTACAPRAGTIDLDSHVLLAGTRIASTKPSRVLYYYRTRLGTVIATSLGGGQPGAKYRYTPYGEVDRVVNETADSASELLYANYLALSGRGLGQPGAPLYHMPARTYDSRLKAFLQPDSVERFRYAYAAGDPLNSSDPTGLLPMASYVQMLTLYPSALLSAMAAFDEKVEADKRKAAQEKEEEAAKSNQAQTRSESEKQEETGSGTQNEQRRLEKEGRADKESNERREADEEIRRLDRQLEKRNEIVKELVDDLKDKPAPGGLPPRGPVSFATWLYRTVRFLIPFIDAAEEGERNRASQQPPGGEPPGSAATPQERAPAEPPNNRLSAPAGSPQAQPNSVFERGGTVVRPTPQEQIERLP